MFHTIFTCRGQSSSLMKYSCTCCEAPTNNVSLTKCCSLCALKIVQETSDCSGFAGISVLHLCLSPTVNIQYDSCATYIYTNTHIKIEYTYILHILCSRVIIITGHLADKTTIMFYSALSLISSNHFYH